LIDKVEGSVAVMCSKENISQIKEYKFSKRIHCFIQSEYIAYEKANLPLFDSENFVYLPSGNGEVLFDLAKENFFGLDFEHLSICNIDNPLWNPEDINFVQMHLQNANEVTIAATKTSGRKMG